MLEESTVLEESRTTEFIIWTYLIDESLRGVEAFQSENPFISFICLCYIPRKLQMNNKTVGVYVSICKWISIESHSDYV